MQIKNYSYEYLPFSRLFKTYTQNFQKLGEFYAANPFDTQAIARKIKGYRFTGDREQTYRVLTAFNRQFNLHEAALENLQRLRDKKALAIVTGQQLGVYGGPLFTIYKTISTIHLARQLEEKFDFPVVPVFWLADEDHDYDEVRSLTILEDDSVEKFSLPPKKNHLPTVADLPLPSELKQFQQKLKETLFDTDFSDQLWQLLDDSFTSGKTFRKGFGDFIAKLFSKHGLILAGSNHPTVKKATGNILSQSIAKADEIRRELEEKSSRLGEGFHKQVTLYDSNLFYLDEEAGRTKISRNGDGWRAARGVHWQTKELVEEIKDHPEKFSPNVFLRPILQDALLPTLGYVAGPGETAYYGQMKGMYSCFKLDMPLIFPRLSATLIEPAIDRILNELPFEIHEYSSRIEDLESEYVDRTEQHDIEAIFMEWKKKAEQIAKTGREEITEIDPTLEGAAGKAMAVFMGELDKLKGKTYRAVKQMDHIQLKRIRRIKANLFPGDGLQERTIAALFYMNKYGIDIWDKLLDSLEEEQFDHHKLIYL